MTLCKLYTMRKALAVADMLNDRVIPFFEDEQLTVRRVLTDGGSEYCGTPESHEYRLMLTPEDIDHSRTKAKHRQTNGITERFHKTILPEFYKVAFRKNIYRTLEELQLVLNAWLDHYNNERTHQGKLCCGSTPMQTFLEGKNRVIEKLLDSLMLKEPKIEDGSSLENSRTASV